MSKRTNQGWKKLLKKHKIKAIIVSVVYKDGTSEEWMIDPKDGGKG